VICVWLSTHDPTADFFSPAARFWEILVGAALTCGEMKRRRAPLGIYRAGLSLTGGIVLAISLVLLHGSDPYPGWRAAMPVLGAALMLAAGQAGLLNRWLLASTPLVWVGLISYPLYLWHWPLLAFARILVGNEPTWQLRASCLAVSMVLAVLTYAVIERPLRFGTHGSKKMAALCATLLLVGGAGLKDWQHNGLLHRYITMHTPPSGLAALLRTSPFVRNCTLDAPHPVAGWCYTDTREPPRYAVLGDSRGEALFWSLVRTSEPHGRWMIAARPGCTPMSDMQRVTHNDAPKLAADDPDLCAAFNAAAINHVLHSDTIRLVLISTARRVLEDEGYAPRPGAPLVANGAFDGLSALVTQLQRAGKAVIFQQDNPALGNSSDCIPRVTGLRAMDRWLLRLRGATCNLDYDSYMSSIRPYLAHIAALKLAHPEMIVFDPTPILCNISEKNCPMVNDGEFLYSYGDHISTYAGDRIATALMPVLGLPLAPM
jgi:hypothetical protein